MKGGLSLFRDNPKKNILFGNTNIGIIFSKLNLQDIFDFLSNAIMRIKKGIQGYSPEQSKELLVTAIARKFEEKLGQINTKELISVLQEINNYKLGNRNLLRKLKNTESLNANLLNKLYSINEHKLLQSNQLKKQLNKQVSNILTNQSLSQLITILIKLKVDSDFFDNFIIFKLIISKLMIEEELQRRSVFSKIKQTFTRKQQNATSPKKGMFATLKNKFSRKTIPQENGSLTKKGVFATLKNKFTRKTIPQQTRKNRINKISATPNVNNNYNYISNTDPTIIFENYHRKYSGSTIASDPANLANNWN